MTPLEEHDDTTKGLESWHGAGCIDLVVNPFYNGRGSIFIPQTKCESQRTTIYNGTSKQTWKLTIPYPKLINSFIITTLIFPIGLACHLLFSRMELPPSRVTDRTSIQPTACFVCRTPFFPHVGLPVIFQNRPKSSVNNALDINFDNQVTYECTGQMSYVFVCVLFNPYQFSCIAYIHSNSAMILILPLIPNRKSSCSHSYKYD